MWEQNSIVFDMQWSCGKSYRVLTLLENIWALL